MEEIKSSYKLIVVNDGSTDHTKELVESYKNKFPIILLNHATNRNVGQVFKTAFEYIMNQAESGDVVITKEADNTSDLSILPAMLKKINMGYDLVLASCYAKEGKIVGTTIDRRILSSMANLLLRLCFPIKGVRTYSSFYRAYRVDGLKKAFNTYDDRFIEEKGFTCMVEMLVKLNRLPIKIIEVPMILRCDFRKGKSKMDRGQTILGYFQLIARELKNKFRKNLS